MPVSLPGEGEKNTVRILIDADARPVVDLAIGIAREHRVEVILLCDWTHELSREDVTTLVVDFDTNKPLLKTLKVTTQSTLVAYKGAKEVARSAGDTSRDGIEKLVKATVQ